MIYGQRGQVTAFIAVAFGIVVMPAAGDAIDSATVSAAAAPLEEATATAAVEASQQIDISEFRATGALSVGAAAARAVAQAFVAAQVLVASITSVAESGTEITIATHEEVPLPFDFFPWRRSTSWRVPQPGWWPVPTGRAACRYPESMVLRRPLSLGESAKLAKAVLRRRDGPYESADDLVIEERRRRLDAQRPKT